MHTIRSSRTTTGSTRWNIFGCETKDKDRPFALAPAGEQLAMGTVPDYGKLGGTLSFLNPATEEYLVHHDVVKKQSITAHAYKNGLVYGGTSVYGGLGTTPSQEEGKLFVWDVAKGKKVSEVVPIPGEKAITALTFDNDGKLWGITAGYFSNTTQMLEKLSVTNSSIL